MRILFLLDDLGAGGAQRQVVSLSNSFYFLGYKVTVLTYSKNSFYRKMLSECGIEVINVDGKRLFSRLIKVRKFIRSGGFETVISFLGPPNFLNIISSLPQKKWKVIVSERSANPAILNSITSRIIRIFYLFADIVVSNSYANLKLVYKINPLLPVRKCKVIYNAIDLNNCKPLKQFHFREHDILTIVVPASYRKLKNILKLIEAVNVLSHEEQVSLSIKWYGDKTPGLNPDEILNEAVDLVGKYNLHSIIQLLPINNEIFDAIKNADVVGLFSFFEGLPNSICEGMAYGKPIITSAVSDIPLFIKDGINGKLCDPGDVLSIASALRYFLNVDKEKLKEMGKLNRQKAIELFDEKKIVTQFLELMK